LSFIHNSVNFALKSTSPIPTSASVKSGINHYTIFSKQLLSSSFFTQNLTEAMNRPQPNFSPNKLTSFNSLGGILFMSIIEDRK